MDIPFDLLYIIASFYTKPKMKLLDWIPEDKLNWDYLSKNPKALHMLEKHPDKIFWCWLSQNPNAIPLLKTHPDKIDWKYLSSNPDLSYAIPLLEENLDNPLAVIDWGYLSANPNAIHLLEKNPNKISWIWLSGNPDLSYAIPLLEKNLDKIDWYNLSMNPNAIYILKKHPMKINWEWISMNPSIFEIDTVQMKIEITKRAKNIEF